MSYKEDSFKEIQNEWGLDQTLMHFL